MENFMLLFRGSDVYQPGRCWIMPPNAPTICGENAALELFKTAYQKFGLRDIKLITVDIFGDGVGFGLSNYKHSIVIYF